MSKPVRVVVVKRTRKATPTSRDIEPPRNVFGADPSKLTQLPFDPWDSGTSALQRAHARGHHAVHQHQNAQQVLAARGRFDPQNGPVDRRALLFAIVQCVEAALVPPPWLAEAFLDIYDKVVTAEVASWDNAFGRPFPKNTDAAALRKRRALAIPIFDAVETERAKKRTKGVGEAIFAKVGSTFNISASRCRDYYNEFKDQLVWRRPFLPISDAQLEKISKKS